MFKQFLLIKLIAGTMAFPTTLDFPRNPELDLQHRSVIIHTTPYDNIISKLKDNNYNTRIEALNEIAEKQINATFNELINLLNDEDYRIRGITAITLGKLTNPDAIPYLMNALKDDHPGVRGSAALSLGRLNATAAEDLLIESLNDSDPTVILSSTYSLGIIKSSKSIKPIINLLNHNQAQIRENAAWVLGLLKAKEAEPYLEALTQDPDESVRTSVKRALFNIKYSVLSDTSSVKYSGGKGSSLKDAIIITGIKNSLACLKSQKDYIKNVYGDTESWEQVNQSHVKLNNKHYTLITIKEVDSGAVRKFYFDITELFSNF